MSLSQLRCQQSLFQAMQTMLMFKVILPMLQREEVACKSSTLLTEPIPQSFRQLTLVEPQLMLKCVGNMFILPMVAVA